MSELLSLALCVEEDALSCQASMIFPRRFNLPHRSRTVFLLPTNKDSHNMQTAIYGASKAECAAYCSKPQTNLVAFLEVECRLFIVVGINPESVLNFKAK